MSGLAAAVVLNRFGTPVTVQALPVPNPLPGAVVIDSLLGGVCGTDLHLQQGHLSIPTPLVLGHEGLGRVARIADGPRDPMADIHGRPLEVGDRVMWASSIACGACMPCRMWGEPTLCDERRTYGVNRPSSDYPGLSGSWAEKMVLEPGTAVVRVPDEVGDDAAMALACAGPTLVHALERRPIRLGETVVVQGSGPVGLAAAAFAQMSGARRVILVGGPPERLELAQAAGIGDDHIAVVGPRIDHGEAATRAEDRVRECTGGRGADLVIECTGVPDAIAEGLRLVRRSGSYLVVGQYTDSGETTINPHQLVYRQLDVVGSWAFSGAHVVRYVERLPALVARFDLASLVRRFPREEAAAAMEAVGAGSVMKAVLS